MMIIYGASKSGETAYQYLTSQKGVEIIGFIDKYINCKYKEISGEKIPVFSAIEEIPTSFIEKGTRILIAVGSYEVAQQIKKELSELTNLSLSTIYDIDFEGGLIGRINNPRRAVELIKLCLNSFNINSLILKDKNNISMRRKVNEEITFLMTSHYHGYSHELASYVQDQLSGRCAFDIGANQGYITSALASKYDRVYAFEPSSDNFEILQDTANLNNHKNIVFEKFACSSYDGEANFYEFSSHSHHSLGDTGISAQERIVKVKTITLDSYCQANKISEISLLKIDVEGFELDVLLGASNLISEKKVKNVIFEFNPLVARNLNKSVSETFDFLINMNFQIYTLTGEKLKKAPRSADVVDLLAISR